jgi:hypothetical protein
LLGGSSGSTLKRSYKSCERREDAGEEQQRFAAAELKLAKTSKPESPARSASAHHRGNVFGESWSR